MSDDWVKSFGTKFVGVMLCVKDEIVYEQHVDDATTLPDTVAMSMGKLRARAAVYPWMGRWALATPGGVTALNDKAIYRRGTLRYFDTKEAAEMVAIHNG